MTVEVAELPPTLSVEHAAKLLGVSRSSAYRAAANGQLPTISFGAATARAYPPAA
jgi:excisionase family DNA binding protein